MTGTAGAFAGTPERADLRAQSIVSNASV